MSTITVIVKPNARKTEILEHSSSHFKIAVKATPEKNKANIELLKFLKKHLKQQVSIKSGLTSKKKILEISDAL